MEGPGKWKSRGNQGMGRNLAPQFKEVKNNKKLAKTLKEWEEQEWKFPRRKNKISWV